MEEEQLNNGDFEVPAIPWEDEIGVRPMIPDEVFLNDEIYADLDEDAVNKILNQLDAAGKVRARRRGCSVAKKYIKSYEKVLEYFHGDELATNVYRDKYENDKSKQNDLSTPDDMHYNIANELGNIEMKYKNPMSYEEIYELLKDFKYIVPGGSVMYGLNTGKLVSLGNCFVIGNHHEKDSYGTIINRDQEQVQLMKRRGGVGHDLSFIRSKGSYVNNSANTSTGVVPFAHRYSNSIKEVAQDGRRGAGMLTLDITHPDAPDFINAKANTDQITGANISLKINDEFMNQVEHKYTREAVELFNLLIKNARNFSEPGILFWDTINRQIDAELYPKFKPVSTNPCGELPLSPYESCRLLALNLYSYVANPFTANAEFDYELFHSHVIKAQRLMDDIVDLEIEYINRILHSLAKEEYQFEEDNMKSEISLWQKILHKTKKGRRTGLGVTGLADALAALNVNYNSNEAITISSDIMSSLMKYSYKSSIILAKERGCFPQWISEEITSNNEYIKRIKDLLKDEPEILKDWQNYGRRSIQNLAIAPTGTISIMTQTSSGVEPVFNLRYTRRKRALAYDKANVIKDENGEYWEEFRVVHNKFKTWYEITHKDSNVDLTIISDKEFDEIVKESPYYKATTHEIDPIQKITLQGGIQKFIDSSISITHNLPEDVTEEEVYNMALYAWQIGCKGFTVYREGSRGGILINKKKQADKLTFHNATERPKTMFCDVNSTMVNGEKWIVIIGTLGQEPYELFAFKDKDNIFDKKMSGDLVFTLTKKKKGHYTLIDSENNEVIDNIISYFETPEEEVVTRLLSWGLRHGGGVSFAYEQLSKSKGNITDFSKAIARVLKKYIVEKSNTAAEKCPECGNIVQITGGCASCTCGWSKCD